MISVLLAAIGVLLIVNAWQAYRFEQWFAAQRLPLPRVILPPPPLPSAAHARRILEATRGPGRELPFLLKRARRVWGEFEDVAPTRLMRPGIHPAFRNWGTEISVAPTIPVW